MSRIDWRLEGVDFVVCNCAFGCPCQFHAPPTYGDCRTALAFRTDRGHFGDTTLDGVVFAALLVWPGAIHEGHGEACLIVDVAASEEQRKAVEALFNGEESEPGATLFGVLTNVIDTYHQPLYRGIEFEADVEARNGRFAIPGIIEARAEPIKHPVTGKPHSVRITQPHGFQYDEAECANGHAKTTENSPLAFDFTDRHAHFAQVTWTADGPVHA